MGLLFTGFKSLGTLSAADTALIVSSLCGAGCAGSLVGFGRYFLIIGMCNSVNIATSLNRTGAGMVGLVYLDPGAKAVRLSFLVLTTGNRTGLLVVLCIVLHPVVAHDMVANDLEFDTARSDIFTGGNTDRGLTADGCNTKRSVLLDLHVEHKDISAGNYLIHCRKCADILSSNNRRQHCSGNICRSADNLKYIRIKLQQYRTNLNRFAVSQGCCYCECVATLQRSCRRRDGTAAVCIRCRKNRRHQCEQQHHASKDCIYSFHNLYLVS